MGTLLWFALLPVVGTVRFLWSLVRLVALLRARTFLAVVGLGVALSMPNPLTAQLSFEAVKPIGSLLLAWGAPVLGVRVLLLGHRSPLCRLVRRKLRHIGWLL